MSIPSLFSIHTKIWFACFRTLKRQSLPFFHDADHIAAVTLASASLTIIAVALRRANLQRLPPSPCSTSSLAVCDVTIVSLCLASAAVTVGLGSSAPPRATAPPSSLKTLRNHHLSRRHHRGARHYHGVLWFPHRHSNLNLFFGESRYFHISVYAK